MLGPILHVSAGQCASSLSHHAMHCLQRLFGSKLSYPVSEPLLTYLCEPAVLEGIQAE